MAASVMSLLEPSPALFFPPDESSRDFFELAFHEPLYHYMDELQLDFDPNNWSLKPPDQWQPHEVCDWLRAWANHNQVQELEVAHLLYNPLSGFELCQLREDYFQAVCPQYGHLIFEALQTLIGQTRPVDPFQLPLTELLHNPCADLEPPPLSSDSEPPKETAVQKCQPAVKKAGGRRGRPPKKDAKSRSECYIDFVF